MTVDDGAIQAWRDALSSKLPPEDVARFTPQHIAKLVKAEYLPKDLPGASRQGLREAKLPPALIDLLMKHQESADVLKQVAVGQEKLAVCQEMLLRALEKIQHLQLQATSATRHASSITIDDLSMVESALQVTWVRMDEGGSSEVEASLADPTEFKWEENIPEPSQNEEYMSLLCDQVDLPPHLIWSNRVDKNGILRTPPGAGGADLPFSIGCRTDALVVLRKGKVDIQGAIAATVELKKKVVQQSVRQAKTTFYCAALLSQMPVLSVLTDMQNVFIALYTDGERDSSTKSTLCIQHTFSSLRSLTYFMHTALESVPKKALMWDEITNTFVQCHEVPNPRRVRLPVPRYSSQRMWKPAMAVLAEHAAGGSDVGRLDDLAAFSDQDSGAEGPIHYSYFS